MKPSFALNLSHDGIGLNPARGLLPEREIDALVARVQAHGGLISYKRNPDGTHSAYELNVNYFDALSAPFGGVRFIPTGGVGPGNVADYLSLPCVPTVGGSWMVPADAVDAGDVARLTSLVRDATAAVGATGAREEGS